MNINLGLFWSSKIKKEILISGVWFFSISFSSCCIYISPLSLHKHEEPVDAAGLQELHWAYQWRFLGLAVVCGWLYGLDWAGFHSSFNEVTLNALLLPSLALKTLLRTYGELSVRMLKRHLTNQCTHLHANGDASVHACVCVCVCYWWCWCVIECTCCTESCQRQTVFLCIDYGWIKQTLVRSVYTKMTV